MKEAEWCWENLAFLVGKGSKIKFWKDSWCTDTPLSHCFNHLFVLAAHRDATIEEMWDQDSGQGDWNLVFVRDFNDWELDMVGDLLHTLRVIGLPWRMIQLCGGREEMVFSGSRKLTGCWISLMPQCFPQGAYGWIGCQLKFVFLLGRLRGEGAHSGQTPDKRGASPKLLLFVWL
ncbi:hypothetical protein CK203_082081 [Vitis vinifera]|uniref:Uncharacterized protein n=1 Tax=Vitis vinifera TaxID=29760 RepID=A0A438E216_VITVI|nr:hypothetical protein CK203_082081 [Vitis vinifera]